MDAKPLPYASAVLRLRSLLCHFHVPDVEAFAMHSAKATLLSWATQLPNVSSDSDRSKQGGQKECTSHSVQLYGRDDVFGALRLQEAVIRSVESGWRRLRAQRRGGEAPLAEQEADLVSRSLDPLEFAVGFRVDFQPSLPKLCWLRASGVPATPGDVGLLSPRFAGEISCPLP